MKIVDVLALRTDEQDTVKEHFIVEVETEHGEVVELQFSLKSGLAMQQILSAVPELQGEEF